MADNRTVVEHQARIARVLALMEAQLDAELDVRALARAAAYSEFHFHRVFRAITGDTAMSYRRRLLLERAARQLRQAGPKILEIALGAGFESHEAFTRAFAAHFGVPPSEYRSAHRLRGFRQQGPEASFARVESRPALQLLGLRHVGPYADVGRTWQRVFELCRHASVLPQAPLGLCWDDPEVTPRSAFRYDACVLAPDGGAPVAGLEARQLAAGDFVVCEHRGSYERLADSYANLMRWALERDLPLSTEPTLERYSIGPDSGAAPDAYRTEIAWRLQTDGTSSW